MDISTLSVSAIEEMLADDGYPAYVMAAKRDDELCLALAVRAAAKEGRVVWTKEKIVIVGRDELTVFPES